MTTKASELVNLIIENMKKHPENWDTVRYGFQNKKNGIQIWTEIGICVYEPYKISLSIWQQLKLRRQIKKCKISKTANLLINNP